MQTFFQAIAKVLVLPLIFMLGVAGYTVQPTPKHTFGDYNPAGAGTYRLQSSIGATDTSLTLSSFKEPVSSLPYTMAYLNSTIEYATLEPSNNTSKEFISFTGITQNSDGTALITGVTRGLSFAFPYTASTTFQQAHSGQSIFILSNPPQLTNMYANLGNAQTITGLWNFSNAPIDNGSSTSTLQFATRAYVNSVAVSGAATSTFTTSGISTLATGAQAANGTYKLTQPNFLSTAISTSTPDNQHPNMIPVTGSTGVLSPQFIATSSADVPQGYTWGATNLFTASTTISGSSQFSSSTIQNLIVTNVVDAPVMDKVYASSTDVTINSSTASTTLLTTVIKANQFGTTNAISGEIGISELTISGGTAFHIELQYGGVSLFTLSTTTTGGGLGAGVGKISFKCYAVNSVSSQECDMSSDIVGQNLITGPYSIWRATKMGTASVDSTQPQIFSIVARAINTSETMTATDAVVYSIK